MGGVIRFCAGLMGGFVNGRVWDSWVALLSHGWSVHLARRLPVTAG